jgi:hypothetical protein
LSKDWKAAGDLASSILDNLGKLIPENPSNTNLVFHNIPHTHNSALVFMTGFEEAVKLMNDNIKGKVFCTETLLKQNNILLKKAYQPARYFIYRGKEQEIEEISQEEWELINIKALKNIRRPKILL